MQMVHYKKVGLQAGMGSIAFIDWYFENGLVIDGIIIYESLSTIEWMNYC